MDIKKLSTLIENQMPAFVRDEYPLFVDFLGAFYEFLEQEGNPAGRILSLAQNQDIDLCSEEFIEYFRREVLAGIPSETLANKRLLAKYISQFYLAKGTERSFKFLFRILFNEDVNFYYPGDDILRSSDGRWVVDNTIWTSANNPNFEMLLSRRITGSISGATATVESARQFIFQGTPITEYTISSIIGVFQVNEFITGTDRENTVTFNEQIMPVFTGVTITNGGTGYQKGDSFFIINPHIGSNGTQISRGEVTSISMGVNSGPVAIGKIIDFGLANFSGGFVDFTGSGDGNAHATPIMGAVTSYRGHWIGTYGQLSSNKKLEDNFFYQDFSYVLRSNVPLDSYLDLVMHTLHPAGMLLFGQVSDSPDLLTVVARTTALMAGRTIIEIRTLFNRSISLTAAKFYMYLKTYNTPIVLTTFGDLTPAQIYGYYGRTPANNPFYDKLGQKSFSDLLNMPMKLNPSNYSTNSDLYIT